jgi:diguanylate cyclase (GGDEF)-like protein
VDRLWLTLGANVALENDTFTPEFSELLKRLTDNVSFALENFDRADEKTKADERIEYLASHDSLTNLPNREMFNGMLRRAIDGAERYQRQFAVLFIDLDRFKVINDSLGHDAGDMLLVEIGGRLRRALRTSDVVARLGGDEFVVILEETAERREVERIACEYRPPLAFRDRMTPVRVSSASVLVHRAGRYAMPVHQGPPSRSHSAVRRGWDERFIQPATVVRGA